MRKQKKAAAQNLTAQEQKKTITIPAPNMKTITVEIHGKEPGLSISRFSEKAKKKIEQTQEAGSTGKAKRGVREAKDFGALYEAAFYRSHEGWLGVNASCFRNASISACRTVGFEMTRAKLAIFVIADGYDALDGTPLVRVYGEPEEWRCPARNASGGVDIRVRPRWPKWSMSVTIEYDADMFTEKDIIHLMMRAGRQVGIGEGRPDSRKSYGMGMGLFTIGEVRALAA